MTIQLQNVTIIAASITGNPAGTTYKGRVLFTLTSTDIVPGPQGGIVVPSQVEVVLSSAGMGVAHLYTNTGGTQGTQYKVEVFDVNGLKAGEWLATVPAYDCYLHDILGTLPTPTVDAAAAAVLAAQGYVAQATTQAAAAVVSATAASGSATAAAGSATAASGSATAAAGSATAAAGSASGASGSAALALQWATSLTVVSGGLYGSAYYAQAASGSATAAAGSATAASTSAGNAAGYQAQALANANNAQTYSASAYGYSNLAQQWATSLAVVAGGYYGALYYAQQASAAVASATAQANAASNASGNAQTSMTAAQQAQALASQFMQLASAAAAQGASYLQQLFTAYAGAAALSTAVAASGASASTAQAQASLAASSAQAAASVAQQDLSGITAQALHRSPNPVTALFVYDTSKDSDGGAWTERMGDKSWTQEPLNGTWLVNGDGRGLQGEIDARLTGATVGTELVTNGAFTNDISGWTAMNSGLISWANGALHIINNPVNGGAYQAMTTVAGQLYVVVSDITSHVAGLGTFLYALGASTGGAFGGTVLSQTVATGAGRRIFSFVATGTTTFINIAISGSGSVDLDNISVKPVTAFNTKSGDYFQLATDGRFYRLWKNHVPNGEGFGSTATTLPFEWTLEQQFGGSVPPSLISPTTFSNGRNGIQFTINGTATANNQLLISPSMGSISSFPIIGGQQYTGTFTCKMVSGSGAPTISLNVLWYDASNTFISAYASAAFTLDATERTYTATTTAAPTNAAYGRVRIAYSTGPTPSQAYTFVTQIGGVQFQLGTVFDSYEARSLLAPSAAYTKSEVFRGNTAKFPKQAAIVAEASNVTIYDLTQPGRPMWGRYVGNLSNAILHDGNVTSVAAAQGIVCVATTTHLSLLDHCKDQAYLRNIGGYFVNTQNLSKRNTAGAFVNITASVQLPTSQVNAVAMTVLPNAPVDPVTGLQVPTIAVATGTGTTGGVTVLKQDGTAFNVTGTDSNYTAITKAGFDKKNRLWFVASYRMLADDGFYHVVDIPSANVNASLGAAAVASLNGEFYRAGNTSVSTPAALIPSNQGAALIGTVIAGEAWGHNKGLTVFKRSPSTQAAGMVGYITGTYNTGWMVGDVRRSLGADTIAGSPTGNNVLTGDDSTFTSSVGAWAANGGTIAATGGELLVSNTGGATDQAEYNLWAKLGGAACIGKTYEVLLTARCGTAPTAQVLVDSQSANLGLASTSSTTNVALRVQFTVPSGASTIALRLRPTGTTNVNATYDTVIVREAVADRSVKAKTSSINGTLSMTAVAAAAQAVAYSGFSNDPAQTTELVTNGSFNTDLSGWTATNGAVWSAGVASLPTASSSRIEQAIPTVAGRTYIVTATIGGNGSFCGAWAAANQSSVLPDPTGAVSSGNRSAGTQTFLFVAASGTSYLDFAANGTGGGTVDNISCKPYTAIGSAANAIQENAWSADLDYGTAQWMAEGWFNAPVGGYGPHNLTFPSNPSVVNAGPGLTVTTGFAVGPDGTSASRVVWSATSNSYYYSAGAAGPGTVTGQFTAFWDVKRNAANTGLIAFVIGDGGNSSQARVAIDQATMTVNGTSVANATVNASSITGPDGNGFYRVSLTGTINSTANPIVQGFFAQTATAADLTIGGMSLHRGTATAPLTWGRLPTTRTAYNGIAPIIDRSGPSGAYWRMGIDGSGLLAYEISDGASTRRVASSVAVNDGNNHKALATYAGNALTLFLDGVQNAQSTGFFPGTLNNPLALLNIGNRFALDSVFPGSVALVRTGATVPFAEQIAFAYAQERQIMQPGAQCALPDTGAVVGLTYDDLADRIVAVTAANEATFVGLERTASAPAASGAILMTAARSAVKLIARGTTNPGVDITMDSLNLREQLYRRAEAAALLARTDSVFDFDAIAAQTDFVGQPGWTYSHVFSAGTLKREGSTKDYTRLDDGFKETVRFGAAPGAAVWVQLKGRRQA